MKKTKICEILNIKYPIIQGGMVWTSGAKLAAACSNAGILGVIGAGSMNLELLESQILKAKSLTSKPFAVNFPIMYERSKEQIDLAYDLGVRIFILSAGSPKKYTQYLKDKGCVVLHVTSNQVLAQKCEDAGVDIVIVEGFEAGGHNGRDELTTMVLGAQVPKSLKVPVVLAGGIASGQSILACLALGASGVQMGTRFLMTHESSAHLKFKELLVNNSQLGTELMLKAQVPVRLLKNKFYNELKEIESTSSTFNEQISNQVKHLGRGRAKAGILQGDIDNGELEIGQIYADIKKISSVNEVVEELLEEYQQAYTQLG